MKSNEHNNKWHIKGKVRDLDLPPLSPYSVKYAGYGIKQTCPNHAM